MSTEQARTLLRQHRESGYRPPDGVLRQPVHERALNMAFHEVSQTAAGQVVLAHLRSFALAQPLGASNEAIRERNALAWLIGVIEQRIEYGRLGKPSGD